MISMCYGIVTVPVCCSVLTPSSLKEPESRVKLSLANTASFFRVDLSSSASLVTSSITSVSSCSVTLIHGFAQARLCKIQGLSRLFYSFQGLKI